MIFESQNKQQQRFVEEVKTDVWDFLFRPKFGRNVSLVLVSLQFNVYQSFIRYFSENIVDYASCFNYNVKILYLEVVLLEKY